MGSTRMNLFGSLLAGSVLCVVACEQLLDLPTGSPAPRSEPMPPPTPRDSTPSSNSSSATAPSGVVAARRVGQNEISCDLYASQLGTAPVGEVRLELQHSTQGASGPWSTLTDVAPTRTDLSGNRLIVGGITKTVPDLSLAEVVHHQKPSASEWYRLRWVRWKSGRVVKTGNWSPVMPVVGGPVAQRVRRGTYEPNPIRSRLIVDVGIGMSAANSREALESRGFSSVALRGPKDHAQRVRRLSVKLPGASFLVSKPFGNRCIYVDDGASSGTSGRVRTGALTIAHGCRDDGEYVRTSILRPLELKQGAAQLGGARRAALDAMVDDFEAEWADLSRDGITLIYYGSPPLDYHDVQSDDLVGGENGLALPMGANMIIGTDSTARSALIDPVTGRPDPVKRFLDWMASNHPEAPVFVEAGLLHQATTEILDAYPNVHTITAFENVFDDADWTKERRLQLRRGAIDPARYPDRMHLVWIASNTVGYIGDAKTTEEKVRRTIETFDAVLDWHESVYGIVAHHNFMLEQFTDEQLAALARRGFRR